MSLKPHEDTYTVTFTKETGGWDFGDHLAECWENSKGQLFRPFDEPSYVARDLKTGQIICRMWTDQNGDWHRDNDKPAYIRTDHAPQIRWFTHGQFTHFSNASLIERDPNSGVVTRIAFDGPIYHQNDRKPLPFPQPVDFSFDV